LIRNGSDKSGENYSQAKPSDFVNNLFEAAKDGKLSSVIYLLANGTNVNSKDSSIIESFLIGLLSIMQVHLVMVVLLNF